MPNHELTPTLADKQMVREFFYVMPMMERGKPIIAEMIWALLGSLDSERHIKILPDYCYNIFKVFQKTFFKGFPLLSETVLVTDQARLSSAKTIEEAKKGIRIDWKNLGRAFGILLRCVRFGDLEAEKSLGQEGFGDLPPAQTKELFIVIFGKKWLEENGAEIATQTPEIFFTGLLNQYIGTHVEKIEGSQANLALTAYQWSPTAMAEFTAGIAEGMNGFMDGDGQFVGESLRAGIYGFLLLAWPEIKAMIESNPKKTLSDLHEWLKPFMRRDMIAYIDIETLRDVCAPPPGGIGLSLRPLKSRASRSSA
jgi:hypothetical protein